MEIDLGEFTTGEKIAGGSGIVTFFAAFMTWVDAGIATVAGTSGDGMFTLAFGAIVVALVVLRDWSTADMAATGLLGLLTVLIALNVYGNLDSQSDQALIEATAGGGLHLTLIGGIGLLAGTGYGLAKERGGEEQGAEET